MYDRTGKKEIIKQLAKRMSTNEQIASEWLEATLETLYGAFKQDDSRTLTVPVLRPLTPQARDSIRGNDEIKLHKFPFRVGRESQGRMVGGLAQPMERRKLQDPSSNDLYLIDSDRRLYVSREHFQIEKKEDGTYELVDRGSTCGTIVDGRLVGGSNKRGRCPLEDGDVIVVGTFKSPIVFKFLLSSE